MTYRKLADCKAVIPDGDKTLWNGRIAEGIGKEYLICEAKKAHLRTAISGIMGALDVKSIVKNDPVYGEAYGLERFYEVLTDNKLGREEEMASFATKYLNRNKVSGAEQFILQWYPKKSFLATLTGSTAAKTAKEYFGMTGYVSNIDRFDESGNFTGVELVIKDGVDKLNAVKKMLKKYNLEVSECAVIGDSKNDIPLAEEAKLLIASPLASAEIRNMADIRIAETYKELLNPSVR